MLKSILAKLPAPANWKAWVLIGLLLKSGIFVWQVSQGFSDNNVNYHDTFVQQGGDTFSYIDPIENLVDNGVYQDDFRMPGYGVAFLPFRMFLDTGIALNILAILQLIFAGISVYLLAQIAFRVFDEPALFHLTFWAFGLSSYSSVFDAVLLTESLSTSLLIGSVYFLVSRGEGTKNLIASGLCLTWAFFMKPVLAPLFGLFLLFLFIDTKQGGFIKNVKQLALPFLIPLILLDGAWIARNYLEYGGIHPVQRHMMYEGFDETYPHAVFNFVQAFGGSIVSWEPGAAVTFFMKPGGIPTEAPQVIPDRAFTSKFNIDSLIEVRTWILEIENESTSRDRRWELIQRTMNTLDSYTESIKSENPILYYLTSRLHVAKTYLAHSGTYNLMSTQTSELGILGLGVKVFYSLFYLLTVALSILGLIWILFLGNVFRKPLLLLLFLLCGYLVFFFPIAMKLDEFRYLVNGYPFMIIVAVFLFHQLYKKTKSVYSRSQAGAGITSV